MFTLILSVVALVIVVVLVLLFRQPDDFSIERSIEIHAPSSAAFARINDLHEHAAWSPWLRLDPNLTQTFDGPTVGLGSAMTWRGNGRVGVGTMTIIESRPNELVGCRLDFQKPLKSTSRADFTIERRGNSTLVGWRMYGKKIFMTRVMYLVMDSDKMIGGQFEVGLANLKRLCETQAAPVRA